jgi:hypothetical protein
MSYPSMSANMQGVSPFGVGYTACVRSTSTFTTAAAVAFSTGCPQRTEKSVGKATFSLLYEVSQTVTFTLVKNKNIHAKRTAKPEPSGSLSTEDEVHHLANRPPARTPG